MLIVIKPGRRSGLRINQGGSETDSIIDFKSSLKHFRSLFHVYFLHIEKGMKVFYSIFASFDQKFIQISGRTREK